MTAQIKMIYYSFCVT